MYLDHAATSWPKPPEVEQAMHDYLALAGGNPGRSGHRLSIAAARVIYDTRELVAELLGVGDPLRIIFTLNATSALNMALFGLLHPGDRVVATGMEHNAVMRPLRYLQDRGVEVTSVSGTHAGGFAIENVIAAIGLGVRLVVITHGSNVTGAVFPVDRVIQAAHQAGAFVLVDAAQTVGSIPTSVDTSGIDLLAFSGHKGLMGPPGTGGLAIGKTIDPSVLTPMIIGGTGSLSESLEQPSFLPDKYESGTPNGVGLAGLGAGVRQVLQRGVAELHAHELSLRTTLFAELADIPGVTVYGPPPGVEATAVVSFTAAGKLVSEIAERLDDEHDVLCRVGLHCAPVAHQAIGTFPQGTVRFSPGPEMTEADVAYAVEALRMVLRS